MTANTPTTTGRAADHPGARAAEPTRTDRRRAWLVLVLLSLLAATVVVVGMSTMSRGATQTAATARADQAAAGRLQGVADQYGSSRTTGADQVATARLQGVADQDQAMRTARVDRASAARLDAAAELD